MSVNVSIVIPTANRRDSVLQTVASALQQDFPASDCEIIVVIDGADEATAQALRALAPASRLVVVQLQTNQGPSAARNAGWRAAKGELILFLDDDMRCAPGLVSAHVAAHSNRSEISEIAGFGAIYVAEDQSRSLAAEAFVRGFGAVYLRHRDHPDEPWPEDVWSFGNTSVPRALLERAGGFDERLRKREDGELGVRLIKAGVKQQFVPGAVAYQRLQKNVNELIHDAEISAECDLLFLEAHPEWTPHDFVTHIGEESTWKRQIRRILSRNIALVDFLFIPVCSIGERRLIPRALRNIGVRSALFLCGLHWYRRFTDGRRNGQTM